MATGNWFYSGKGIKGDIQKTSGTGAAGTYDVYTIFYTDGSASQYSIYNGKDGASLPPDLSAYSTKAQADLLYKPIGWTPDLSAYITKSQSDGYYLGINAQASDSAKLGGHLPSYFQIALGYTPLNSSLKGAVNGLAELGADGFVLNTQLPAYVDKIINVSTYSSLPATGVTAAIYITDDTNVTYRWSGSSYVEISSSLALGETNATAYRGDRGAIAYSHSQLTSGNPHNVTKANVGLANVPNLSFSGSNTGDQDLSGLVPKTYTVNGHALSGNVAVTQADLGLVIGTNVLAYRTFGSAANNNTSDFEVPLTFSTGLTRTGNTITNNITQYTDALARSAQTNSSIVTALGYTPLSNATSFRTVNSVSVVGSGDISINPFPGFGTGNGAAWGYSAHPTTISGYGITDAILNQNISAQSANIWINGSGKFENAVSVPSLEISNSSIYPTVGITQASNYLVAKMGSNGFILRDPSNSIDAIRSSIYGEISFASTSKATSFIGEDALSGSYLNNYIELRRVSTLGGCRIQANRNSAYGGIGFKFLTTASNSDEIAGNYTQALVIDRLGTAAFASTVTATSFYGSASNLTNLPINLTTNNTSGAATYTQATNTLNVPNYTASSSYIQNQFSTVQTASMKITGDVYCQGTVSATDAKLSATYQEITGSTSGYLYASQPFSGASYKKVILRLSSLTGTATYTFPVGFSFVPAVVSTNQLTTSTIGTLNTTTVSVAGSNTSGFLILEGY